MANLKINKDQYLSFLKTIQPNAETFVFQTFTDNKATTRYYRQQKVRDPLACSFVATPEQALPRLEVLQNKGAGVFIQLNTGVGRGKSNITALSAYFVDTDGAPIGPVIETMPKPLGITSSSTGNYHVYWRTMDALEKFRPTQKALAIALNCDEAMVNLDRVVRLPGSWHLKNPDNPIAVKFQPCEDKLYTAEELLSYLKSTTGPDLNAGLITDNGGGYELPEALPAGDRTRHLISYAGQLAAQGYGEQHIRDAVKQVMIDRLPVGDDPVPDETLEIEIYPAVSKFVASHTKEAPASLPAPIVAAPEVPQLPDAGAPMSLAQRATRDARELMTLEQFDQQFYYVEKGRKIVHVRDDMSIKVLNLDEFKTSYGNIKRGGKPLYKAWIEGAGRVTAQDIQYYPGESRLYDYHGNLMVNNYEPTNLITVEEPHPAQMQVFLDHIQYLFPEPADAELFLKWMAVTIQKPSVRVPWAPFLISSPGVGKGWLFQLLQKLMGYSNCAVIGPKDLDGGFNEFMFEKTLVLIDELKMTGRNQYDLVEILKPLITDQSILVNIKFGAKGTYPVFPNIICFSNHGNAQALDSEDRRNWVHKINAVKRDAEYYNRLFKWLGTDGPAHVHSWLSNLNISDWDEQAPPPMTAAKRNMIEAFKSEIQHILDDAIEDHVGPFVADVAIAEVVYTYVQDQLKKDKLDRSESNQVKNYLLNNCAIPEPIENQRLHVEYGAKGAARKHMIIFREFDKWCTAPAEELIKESERSWRASIGEQPGATMGLVTTK